MEATTCTISNTPTVVDALTEVGVRTIETHTLFTAIEPLHHGAPDDDQERAPDAREARGLHRDAEQAELIYRDGGHDLYVQQHADGGGRPD